MEVTGYVLKARVSILAAPPIYTNILEKESLSKF